MKNNEYIEIDSLKEIFELKKKGECYFFSELNNKIIGGVRDTSICMSDKYYKKNPNYRDIKKDKYIGKTCVSIHSGNSFTIEADKTDINRYNLGSGCTYCEKEILDNFIIEGINDK